MAVDYELSFSDYLAILRRRFLLIALTVVSVSILAIIVAVLIPPVYQSAGTILIESQQIPTDLVQTAVTTYADERIEVIKQRVMTRDNLIKIIDKYHLYEKDRKSLTVSELTDLLRTNISVDLLSADVKSNQGNKATIAFKVSYNGRYPDVTNKVTNELVTLFLDENVKARTKRASETTEFLNQEADKLQVELEKIENQVAAFKQQNASALPEHKEMQMSSYQGAQVALREIERDYKATQDELSNLDIDLSAAKAGIGTNSANSISSPAAELEKLKTEYTKLSGIYKENHPSLRNLRSKIETLEKSGSATSKTDSKVQPVMQASDFMTAKVQAKIDSAKSRLVSLSQQRASLQGKLGQLEHQITQSPQVEQGLFSLQRDYESAKKKYEEVRFKQNSAKISESLEQENKAERFALIEPPSLPDKPIKPDRVKVMVMGVLLSFALAGGLVMVLESLNKRIRGADALTALMHEPPLVIIPYIQTQKEIIKKKLLLKWGFAGAGMFVLLAIVAVNFFVMPLDILMIKLFARLS